LGAWGTVGPRRVDPAVESLHHPGAVQLRGDKAKYALRTVDDLRQLNQLFSYTRAQDSAQEQGVCDESVIGGSPQWLE
jgi:hypothetical protein